MDNTELFSKLLEVFNKKIEKLLDKINKENLLKYKFGFDQIIINREEII